MWSYDTASVNLVQVLTTLRETDWLTWYLDTSTSWAFWPCIEVLKQTWACPHMFMVLMTCIPMTLTFDGVDLTIIWYWLIFETMIKIHWLPFISFIVTHDVKKRCKKNCVHYLANVTMVTCYCSTTVLGLVEEPPELCLFYSPKINCPPVSQLAELENWWILKNIFFRNISYFVIFVLAVCALRI